MKMKQKIGQSVQDMTVHTTVFQLLDTNLWLSG